MPAAAEPPRLLLWRTRHEKIALRLPFRAVLAAGLLAAFVLGIIALSLTQGSYPIGLPTLYAALIGEASSQPVQNVVWEFRFPRVLAAALTGAMLALSGGALQNVTRNGLADPSLIGISQGAALAVVGAIIAFPELNIALRPFLAFGGAIAVAGLIQLLSRTRGGASPLRFILMGIGLSAFISSVTTALLTYGNIERAAAALAWLAGSVNAASWDDVRTLSAALLLLAPPLFMLTRVMATLALGTDTAIGLGAPVRRARLMLTAIAVGLAASAVAIVGPFGFVGLIAPHAARRIARAGAALHALLTALTGAALVALADFVGRTAFAPLQIPAGLLTAIIGAPIFFWLMRRAGIRENP